MVDTPTRFDETARRLHRFGWRPIPLAQDTKQPVQKGWPVLNRYLWPDDKLSGALRCFSGNNYACGLAIQPELCVFDVDILDAERSQHAEAVIRRICGETPLTRIGLAPKTMLFYRSDGSTQSKKPMPIEIFSGTGQVAAFAHHAKAGRPYLWPDENPLNLAADDRSIPRISGSHVIRVLQELDPLLRTIRQEGRQNGEQVTGALDAHERLKALQRRLDWPAAADRLLSESVLGSGAHYAVYAVITSAWRHRVTTDELDDLLAGHPEIVAYVGDDYIERTIDAQYIKPLPAKRVGPIRIRN
jgi:hypothetical protein